jgi:cytochrome oxidase Cu insertion factor (SCO1/SenC/PrrC family)
MRKQVLLAVAGLVGVAVLAVGGFAGYMELVKAGYIRYNRFDHRERGSLRVGGAAPDLELTAYDGAPVQLSRLWAERPVMLVFGSCT